MAIAGHRSWAAEKGHEAVVELLLEKCANTEAEDGSRHSPRSEEPPGGV